MTLSVRMNPLLEKELERAARRLGVTKTQFVVSAVERALGHNDPATLYQQVMEEAASYRTAKGFNENGQRSGKATVQRRLRARHTRDQEDYAAYLQKRKAAVKDQS